MPPAGAWPGPVAVGMVDLVEDPQRTGPGPAGGLGVARAALDVAQTVERVGLVETVASSRYRSMARW